LTRNQELVFRISVIAVLAILFLAPVIPSRVASYTDSPQVSSTPSMIPPVNWGVLVDPSGTYWIHFFDNGTFAMNLTSYQRLLNDPYSTNPSSCPHVIEGNTILITCPTPSPSTLHGSLTDASPTSPTHGLESVSYLLIHHGAVYFEGRYTWN
jgi:hypothetical protein